MLQRKKTAVRAWNMVGLRNRPSMRIVRNQHPATPSPNILVMEAPVLPMESEIVSSQGMLKMSNRVSQKVSLRMLHSRSGYGDTGPRRLPGRREPSFHEGSEFGSQPV